MKKTLSLLSALFLLLSSSVCTGARSQNEQSIRDTAQYLTSCIDNPTIGSVGGEWLILGLARSNAEAPDGYFEKYYQNVCEYVRQRNGVLHSKKYTEYSRVILALTAIGKNPENTAGFNLLTPLGDYKKVIFQGINGPIFALIALDSKNYEIPVCESAETQATREMYKDYILKRQNADGGFALSDESKSDVDITAMALQALSKYSESCKTAVDRALEFLSGAQLADGGYESYGTQNCESCCQVVTALSALGIKADDPRFVKNGNSVTDALMSFYSDNGGFSHTRTDSKADIMSSEQGLYALCAYERMLKGQNALYDMTDTTYDKLPLDAVKNNPIIKTMPVVRDGAQFTDIGENAFKEEINELARRDIISGKSENIFDPDAELTRAEFAAIAVRALGLPQENTDVFTDVSASDWYCGYVGAAYRHGIVKGVSEARFNPDGTISREEAAVMVSRCAGLCGSNTQLVESEFTDGLARLDGSTGISDWARDSLAFCLSHGILPDNFLDAEPQTSIKRCETAYIIYNLLNISELLQG